MKINKQDIVVLLFLWMFGFITAIGNYGHSELEWESKKEYKIKAVKTEMGIPHWLTICSWKVEGRRPHPSSLPESSEYLPGVSIHYGWMFLALVLSGAYAVIVSLWVAPLVTGHENPSRRQFIICLLFCALIAISVGMLSGLDLIETNIKATLALGSAVLALVIMSVICQSYRAAVALSLCMTTLVLWGQMFVANIAGSKVVPLTTFLYIAAILFWFVVLSLLLCLMVCIVSHFRKKPDVSETVSNPTSEGIRPPADGSPKPSM